MSSVALGEVPPRCQYRDVGAQCSPFSLNPALAQGIWAWKRQLTVAPNLGDFCQRTYHLACLFVRLLCRDNSYIARLCACYRFLKTNENPAQSGTFFSGNRLITLNHQGNRNEFRFTLGVRPRSGPSCPAAQWISPSPWIRTAPPSAPCQSGASPQPAWSIARRAFSMRANGRSTGKVDLGSCRLSTPDARPRLGLGGVHEKVALCWRYCGPGRDKPG
jgi:hypothetical protein